MKVLIVGGVYGRDDEYRRTINPTPEMTLADGLCRRGVDVATAAHLWRHDLDGIDVVHVHHLARSVPWLALRRAAVGGPALVFTRHNEETVLPWRRALPLRLLNRYADALVALSHQEADRLREVARGPVTVIRNGIDAPDAAESPAAPTDGVWRLLFVGQLIERKGIDVLLRALADVRRTVDARLRLVFHNAELRHELGELTIEFGLEDAVEFVGRCGPEALVAEYARAHLLVLPSRAEAESLPSVIIEALRRHRPVIASADAGIPEQVLDAGELVAPEDTDGFALAVREVLEDYDSYVSAARRRAKSLSPEYDVETMIDAHLELYRRLSSAWTSRRAERPAGS